eukprot:SAG31_NODE_202_length_20512_cov_62.659237_5_plen_96_part_00
MSESATTEAAGTDASMEDGEAAAAQTEVRAVTFSFLCPLLENYGTFIAKCNALIEKVSPCRTMLNSPYRHHCVRSRSALSTTHSIDTWPLTTRMQ